MASDAASWTDPRTVTALVSNFLAIGALIWNVTSNWRGRRVVLVVSQFDADIRDTLYDALSDLQTARSKCLSQIDCVAAASNKRAAAESAEITVNQIQSSEISPVLDRVSDALTVACRQYPNLWNKSPSKISDSDIVELGDPIFDAIDKCVRQMRLIRDLDSVKTSELDIIAETQVLHLVKLDIIDTFRGFDSTVRAVTNDIRSLLSVGRHSEYRYQHKTHRRVG